MLFNFTSQNSYKIYLFLKQGQKRKLISLQEFRKYLGVKPSEGSRFAYFQNNVLDKAIEEINKTTDINVSYVAEKNKGAMVTDLVFKMKKK